MSICSSTYTVRWLPDAEMRFVYAAVECAAAAGKKKSERMIGFVFKSAVYMPKFLCRLPRAIADHLKKKKKKNDWKRSLLFAKIDIKRILMGSGTNRLKSRNECCQKPTKISRLRKELWQRVLVKNC